MPRSRVREWEKDSKPQPLLAIEEMRGRGWLDDMRSESGTALNAVIAWTFASDGITYKDYSPVYHLSDSGEISSLTTPLRTLGLGYNVSDREGHMDQLRITGSPTLLGRAIVAAGVPRNSKDFQAKHLPEYLSHATTSIRRHFARLYFFLRAHPADDPWEGGVELAKDRPATYIDDVTTLYEQELGRTEVERAGRVIHLSETAVERLVE